VIPETEEFGCFASCSADFIGALWTGGSLKEAGWKQLETGQQDVILPHYGRSGNLSL
jgi:hypothetical protein